MNELNGDTIALALETIDEAVGIYDAEDQLAGFNGRYANVRSAIGGDVTLGVRWDDLVTASVRSGSIPEAVGREEEWLEQRRRARGAYSIVRKLPDGTSYQVNERRMPNGGIAVVWTDISGHMQAGTAECRALGDVLATIAHELSESLTAIGNYIGGAKLMLQRDRPNPTMVTDALSNGTEQVARSAEALRLLRDLANNSGSVGKLFVHRSWGRWQRTR